LPLPLLVLLSELHSPTFHAAEGGPLWGWGTPWDCSDLGPDRRGGLPARYHARDARPRRAPHKPGGPCGAEGPRWHPALLLGVLLRPLWAEVVAVAFPARAHAGGRSRETPSRAPRIARGSWAKGSARGSWAKGSARGMPSEAMAGPLGRNGSPRAPARLCFMGRLNARDPHRRERATGLPYCYSTRRAFRRADATSGACLLWRYVSSRAPGAGR